MFVMCEWDLKCVFLICLTLSIPLLRWFNYQDVYAGNIMKLIV